MISLILSNYLPFWKLMRAYAEINIAGAVGIVLDKVLSIINFERFPEKAFYICSLVGGTVGIILGMLACHHKVSKTDFWTGVVAAGIPQAIFMLAYFRPSLFGL